MADPFEKMAERIQARLGVTATLAGGATTDVVVEHGVEVSGDYGEVTAYRDVVSIRKTAACKVGDRVTIGGTAYVLDGILKSDGYFVQFVLRPA